MARSGSGKKRVEPAPPAAVDPNQQRLALPQPLKSSTASHAELTRRLTAVHEQLQDFDQDNVDLKSLDAAANQLVDPTLLLHKDKSVKALVAACLVDVLRLYAPEAPYSPAQLYDLFEFLTNQLRAAGDPKDPNQPEHFYVLDSLASVKSIVIVCDLDQADSLLTKIFYTVFDTVSSQTPKNVTLALSDILLALLDEAASIPTGVVEAIVSQFAPSRVSTKAGKGRGDHQQQSGTSSFAHEKRAAFRLAVDVARAASDKLQRYVSQYFIETVLAHADGSGAAVVNGKAKKGYRPDSEDDEDRSDSGSDTVGSDMEDDDDNDDETRTGGGGRSKRKAKTKARAKLVSKRENRGAATSSSGAANAFSSRDPTGEYSSLSSRLVEAHRLIRSINRHVPALLINVIPSIAEELTAAQPTLRVLATDYLGSMLGEPVGHGDVAKLHPAVWKEWLKRARDREAKVRIKMCDRLGVIWREHPELARDLEAAWSAYLLTDHDEKVRIAASGILDGVDYEMAKHHVSQKALEALAERLTDKKERVRVVAYRTLGRLYDAAFTDMQVYVSESGDEPAYNQFGWIPASILDSLTAQDGSPGHSGQLNHVLATLADYIVPLPDEKDVDDTASWTDRFLLVESSLATVPQRQGLMNATRLTERLEGGVWTAYVDACMRYNGGLVDDKEEEKAIKEFLRRVIAQMSTRMPDPEKATQDFNTFAQENEAQLYRELRVMLDPQTDLKTLIKNKRDFLKRVAKFKSSGESVANTFACMIRVACATLINRSSIPQLLKRITLNTRDALDALGQSAQRVLDYVARHRPVMFRSHVPELSRMLNDPSIEAENHLLVLRSLVKYKVAAKQAYVVDAKVAKRILELAKGDDEKLAKQAATLIALDETRLEALEGLVEHLADQLSTASDEELVPLLAASGRLARHAREACEAKSDAFVSAALEVITRGGGEGEIPDNEEVSWFEADEMPPRTRARCLSIKLLVNRCLAFAGTGSAAEVAKPVFDMLWPLLVQFGGGQDTYSPPVSARIRLEAGLGFLKLLTVPEVAYAKAIVEPSRFEALSRLAQDSTFEVREAFLRKLLAYLRGVRFGKPLLPRVHMILFLVAHEPEDELKQLVLSFVSSKRRLPADERTFLWEAPFVRLVFLLAHHPDLDTDADALEPETVAMFAKYLEEYFQIFLSAENISYLYNFAMKLKTTRDKRDHRYDRNLYILSELSIHLIKMFGRKHNWPIPTYPGQLKLPADLFEIIQDVDARKKVLNRVYLDEAVLEKLDVGPEKKRVVVSGRKRAAAAQGLGDGEAKPKKRVKTSPSSAPKRKGGATKGKGKGKAKGGKKKQADKWDSDAEDESDEAIDSEDDDDDDQDASGDGEDSNAEIVARLNPGSAKKAATTASRGQRGGLRSDQDKKLQSGLGQDDSDDGSDKMDVDEPAAVESPSKSKVKPKADGVSNGEAAASPAAAKGRKGKATKAKAAEAKARPARKGLAEPRKLKAGADLAEISDVGDSDDDKENDSD